MYKLRIYKLSGSDKGNLDHEEIFSTREEMVARYNELFKYENYSLNPTAWEKYQNQIDDKLWELQKACNRYKEIDPLADWVLFAINRHISTGRATRQFEVDFVNYPKDKLESLIKKCLNGDRSQDGIIKTVKRIISK